MNARTQGRINNAQGKHFEDYIMGACRQYAAEGRAKIQKTPEPFRVIKKNRDGTALVQFTANAEPDFIGGDNEGNLIVFEAKRTLTDKLKQDVITPHQWKALEEYSKMPMTIVGVCAGIHDKAYWVDWEIWKNMKQLYGRKHVTQEDLKPFELVFDGSIRFLDFVDAEAFLDTASKLYSLIMGPLK